MKSAMKFAVLGCLLGLLAPVSAIAGKGDKANKPEKPHRVFARFDKNTNGVLDADEKEAVQKAFKDGNDAGVKALDTNTDGKLDDTEMDALKARKKKAEGETTGKRKKNK